MARAIEKECFNVARMVASHPARHGRVRRNQRCFCPAARVFDKRRGCLLDSWCLRFVLVPGREETTVGGGHLRHAAAETSAMHAEERACRGRSSARH